MLCGLDRLPAGVLLLCWNCRPSLSLPAVPLRFEFTVVAVGMRDGGKVRGDGDRGAGVLSRLEVMIPGPRQLRSLKWGKKK